MVTENGNRPNVVPEALVNSRPDALSGAILASSVLFSARKSLPKTRIFLLVQKKFAALYVNHPALDGIFTISPETNPEELASNFRKQKIDALAHLKFSETVAKAVEIAGIREISAFENESRGNAKFEILRAQKSRERHEIFQNFEVLSPFGVVPEEKPKISLSVYGEARFEAFQKVKKYFVPEGENFAIFCLDPNRENHGVAPEVFAEAASWLSKNEKMPILVVGESEKTNREFLKFCSKSHGAHIIDLRGETSAAETAQLLKSARICLSAENAFSLLAATMNCPNITLFVDFSESRWMQQNYFSTNIFTGARRFIFEPKRFYERRAAKSFKHEKIAAALRFSLALKEENRVPEKENSVPAGEKNVVPAEPKN